MPSHVKTPPPSLVINNDDNNNNTINNNEKDQSPLAPGKLQAREKTMMMSRSDMEKMLLERLLLRKELRLKTISEKLEKVEKELLFTQESSQTQTAELQEIIVDHQNTIKLIQGKYNGLKKTRGLHFLLRMNYCFSCVGPLLWGLVHANIQFLMLFYTVPMMMADQICTGTEYAYNSIRRKVVDGLTYMAVNRILNNNSKRELQLQEVETLSQDVEEQTTRNVSVESERKQKRKKKYFR